jgi:hypothetical protein
VPAAVAERIGLSVVLPLRSSDRSSLIEQVTDSMDKLDADVIIGCGLTGTELAAAVAKTLPSDHRRLGWIFLGLDASLASERMGVNFRSNELKAASGSFHERLQGPVIVLTPESQPKDEAAMDMDTPPQVNVSGVLSDTLLLPTVHPTNVLPLGDIGGVAISSIEPENLEEGDDVPASPTMHIPNLVRIIEIDGAKNPEEAALKAVESGELEGWVGWVAREAERGMVKRATSGSLGPKAA